MDEQQPCPAAGTSTAATASSLQEGTAATPNGADVAPQPAERQPARWDSSIWSYERQAALEFATEADLDATIDLLWNDSELRGLPRVHVGDNTMIVPAEAVPFFQKKARHFVVRPVVNAGDLSPEEAAEFRRGTWNRS